METTAMSRDEGLKKLRVLVKGISICMLTTQHDGELRSRPMMTQDIGEDGHIYFFTKAETAKVCEIESDAHVNVAYAKPDDHLYVSASGIATAYVDVEFAREHWNPMLNTWFEGPDDPDLRMIRVKLTGAEYWDSPGNKMVQLFGMIASAIAGREILHGENRQVDLR
jgi:general stress protein 26